MGDEQPVAKRDTRDGWFEFFYDVILACALASMHDAFLKTFSVRTALVTGTVAAMVFTVWFITSLVFNRFPGHQPFRRVIVLVQMAALVVVALAADFGAGVSVQAGLIAYAVALATVALLYWTAPGARDAVRKHGTRVLVVVLIVEVIVVALAVFVPGEWAWLVLIGTCMTAFLALFLATRPQLDSSHPIDAEHLADRMGSFIVVVIGMGFAQLILDVEGETGINDWRFFILIFVTMFTLWWMYFTFDLNLYVFHSATDRYAWMISHYLILIGIVGMNDVLSALAADFTTAGPIASIAFTGAMLGMTLLGFAVLAVLSDHLTMRHAIALIVVALIVAGSTMISEVYLTQDLRTVALIMVAVLVGCAGALSLSMRGLPTPRFPHPGQVRTLGEPKSTRGGAAR